MYRLNSSGGGVLPVRAASTVNTVVATGLINNAVFGGVTLVTGDLVLLKDQTVASENGIYTVVAAGAATRSSKMSLGSDAFGALVTVRNGSSITITYSQTADPAIVGTNSLVFAPFSQGVLPEYGQFVYSGAQVTVTTVQNTSALAADFMTFTLPSAGVWDVNYVVHGVTDAQPSGQAAYVLAGVYTSANVFLANTEIKCSGFINTGTLTAQTSGTGSGTTQITTTGLAVYKVRVWNPSGAVSANVFSNINGRSSVTWTKISGLVPVAGTMVDYFRASRTLTGQQIPSSGVDVLFNSVTQGNLSYVPATGYVTLLANKTYQLTSQLKSRLTTSGGLSYARMGVANSAGQVIPSTTQTGSGTSVDLPGMSFTAPLTGTYQVTATVRAMMNNSAATIMGTCTFGLFDSSNTLMGNSETDALRVVNSSAAGMLIQASGTLTYQLNATAGTTYKLRCWNTDATGTAVLGLSDGNGRTYMNWSLISAPLYLQYDFVDSSNATFVNATSGIDMHSSSTLDEGSATATAIVTPLVNTDVKVRVTGISLSGGSRMEVDITRSYLEVKQLGSSSLTGVSAPSMSRVSSNYIVSALAGGQVAVYVDATSGPLTVTLPLASASPSMVVAVKKVDSTSNAVNIVRSGADLIDGLATFPITAQYDSNDFRADSQNNFWGVH